METPTPECEKMIAIENIILQEKTIKPSSPILSTVKSSPTELYFKHPVNILERCFNTLKCLDNFWITYNKVKVDYMEIKIEKQLLEKNNKQLRGMVRGVLEAIVLSKSQPTSNVSTRMPSRSRSGYSVPLKRIIS